MGYQLITGPTGEPVSLAEAKLHLRVDSGMTDDDTLIAALITAARQYAEQKTMSSFMTQTWKYVMDSFPGRYMTSVPWGAEYSQPGNAVLLEKGPITAITAINYLDMASTQQTMPGTDYIADMTGPLARVTPVFGKIWPITMPQIGSASIVFTAGYGAASAVPEGIKSWIKLRIGALYENREEFLSGSRVAVAELPFVDSLLDPYRIDRY